MVIFLAETIWRKQAIKNTFMFDASSIDPKVDTSETECINLYVKAVTMTNLQGGLPVLVGSRQQFKIHNIKNSVN